MNLGQLLDQKEVFEKKIKEGLVLVHLGSRKKYTVCRVTRSNKILVYNRENILTRFSINRNTRTVLVEEEELARYMSKLQTTETHKQTQEQRAYAQKKEKKQDCSLS
jgi:hypothetical protein